MKILITGGAGFIGSELAKHLLLMKQEVTLLDNMSYGHLDNLEWEHGNLKELLIVDDVRSSKMESYCQDIDVIFHLAGISSLPEC